jgi:hypothetical protein
MIFVHDMYSNGHRPEGFDVSVGYEASRDCSEHKVNSLIVLLDVAFVSLLFVYLSDCLLFYSCDYEMYVLWWRNFLKYFGSLCSIPFFLSLLK